MSGLKGAKLTQEALLRVVADTIFVNSGLIASYTVHFFFLVVLRTHSDYSSVFWQHLSSLKSCALILTLVCLTVFLLSGFYTYGLSYRRRNKAVAVFQAVSIAFLSFGLASHTVTGFPTAPLSVLFLAWILTASLMVLGRLWANAWECVIVNGSGRQATPDNCSKVLVIGGAGYIGSALLPKLLAKGYSVRLMDMLLYGNDGAEAGLRSARRLGAGYVALAKAKTPEDLLAMSLSSLEVIRTAFQEADAIFTEELKRSLR
ncbi:NAD-dependent epimerase/dehydratase family protein [bacterium CPR1]|nr:NAD-dependent epimerase/dehydratase family protein [bacterium CPR1]